MSDAIQIFSDGEDESDEEIKKSLEGTPAQAEMLRILRLLHRRSILQAKAIGAIKFWIIFVTGASAGIGLIIGQSGVVGRLFGG